MKAVNRRLLRVAFVLVAAALGLNVAGGSGAWARPRQGGHGSGAATNSPPVTLDLKSFGAAGDGLTDDGPALQAALDALAAAGGGTLFVPAGRYAVATPVSKNFAGLDASIKISGVASDTPAPSPGSSPTEQTHGLDLMSEFLPRTGQSGGALALSGLRSLVINDLAFVGTPGADPDAAYTLAFVDVDDATVSHCEFYGLSSSIYGSDLFALRSRLRIERSVFLGCTANSGVYTSVVQNLQWKGFALEQTVFMDYGQRPELFTKTGYSAPLSWVELGNAAALTNDSPRREAVFRSVFLDEGGFIGIAALPTIYQPPSAPIDLVYVSGLKMNVTNLTSTGHYFSGGQRGVLVEDSVYGWSNYADSAIDLHAVGHAILDRVVTWANATRLRADAATARLTVINSVYKDLASLSPQTVVINTTLPDADPVRYVRGRFESALGRAPDAAAHFYWSDSILRCGANAACDASRRAALDAYLASAPSETFEIRGRVADDDGAPVEGAAVALAGSQAVSTTTDASGLYHFSNLPTSGVYTVTVSRRHYTFAAPSQTFTTPARDVTADFGAKVNRYAVRGGVTDDAGRALAGAVVSLSGSKSATTTSDASGNYSFEGVAAGGAYAVSAAKDDYAFAPASRSFTDLSADARADFLGTPTVRSIRGRVTNSNNGGLVGVTVTLSGSRAATATTAADGSYSFDRLPVGGSYVVTPARPLGYVFTPDSRGFANLSADQSAGFVGNYFEYKLTGRVTKSDGTAVSGVAVTLTGSKAGAATTDANGNYTLAGLPAGGDYTVKPSKTDYAFAPPSATLTALGSDKTTNFTATPGTHSIRGRVTGAGGSALAGATVTLSGSRAATALTDANGEYSFTQLASDGTYSVAASKANYAFTPPSLTFEQPSADKTADFAGALVSYRISGRVADGASGLAGVTVKLSGAQSATAKTDAGGAYSFTVQAEGDYTVTASKARYAFAPPSQTFGKLGGDKTADFAASVLRFAISGRVVDANKAGLQGVTLTLAGTQSATTATGPDGSYTFANLAATGAYAVTPSRRDFVFTPASQTFEGLDADARADFGGDFAVYRVAGRVTEKGAGLAGVALDLEGSHPALGAVGKRLLTGADGSYSFNVVAGGSYTVRPSKTDYTFAPASASFAAVGGDRAADFDATHKAFIQFASAALSVGEGGGTLEVTVTRGGDTSSEVSAVYEVESGTALLGSDVVGADGRVTFAPGETEKTFTLFITDDTYVEGEERFSVRLTPEGGAEVGVRESLAVTIGDNDTDPSALNAVDGAEFFVRQHYRDFLGRDPDAAGLAFWKSQLAECGADVGCRDAKRVNVSAAFFLSIEFQETGFFAYKTYVAAYGRAPERLGEFTLDASDLGAGVVVGEAGWPERLEHNKGAYVADFVARPQFEGAHPVTLTPAQFVSELNANAGVTLTPAEAAAAAALFGGAQDTADLPARARVLRLVVENAAFHRRETSPAFVRMQYFGYLRREPDAGGYAFWLEKLDSFGGDYRRAEMVKAFIASDEYRRRFGR